MCYRVRDTGHWLERQQRPTLPRHVKSSHGGGPVGGGPRPVSYAGGTDGCERHQHHSRRDPVGGYRADANELRRIRTSTPCGEYD